MLHFFLVSIHLALQTTVVSVTLDPCAETQGESRQGSKDYLSMSSYHISKEAETEERPMVYPGSSHS